MTGYNLSAYLHHKGAPESPIHSEYEVEMAGVDTINLVKNASVVDNFIIVDDETKPVYVLAATIGQCLFKFDDHTKLMDPKKITSKVGARAILPTDINCMIVQQMDRMRIQAIKLRVGDEVFWMQGDMAPNEEVSGIISAKDLLDFVSGEISWSALRGRSYIYEREARKEFSRQEIIRNLSLENSELKKQLSQANGSAIMNRERLRTVRETFETHVDDLQEIFDGSRWGMRNKLGSLIKKAQKKLAVFRPSQSS